jgi:hypothetical protein
LSKTLPVSIVPQRDLQIAENDHQQVVEIMGNAAGQLPDRFHFLRLPEAGFQRLTSRGLGVHRPRAAHRHENKDREQRRGGDTEDQEARHVPEPAADDVARFQAGTDIEREAVQLPHQEAAFDLVDSGDGGVLPAVGRAPDKLPKAGGGVEPDSGRRRQRISCQQHAVVPDQREARTGTRRERRIGPLEGLR